MNIAPFHFNLQHRTASCQVEQFFTPVQETGLCLQLTEDFKRHMTVRETHDTYATLWYCNALQVLHQYLPVASLPLKAVCSRQLSTSLLFFSPSVLSDIDDICFFNISSRLSITKVTGPSFISSTSIISPNFPSDIFSFA